MSKASGRTGSGRFLRESRTAIELLVRDRILGGEPFSALQLGGCALDRGARAEKLRAQTIDLGLKRPGVDFEEQVARNGFR